MHPKAIAFIRTKPCMVAVAAMAVMYWSHRALRVQYHRQCNADLIRVVFFNQSQFCANLSGVLAIVEVATHQVFGFFAMSVWNALGSAGVAMAGCAAAAAASAAAAMGSRAGQNAQQRSSHAHAQGHAHAQAHAHQQPMSVIRGLFSPSSKSHSSHAAVAAENVQNNAYMP